MKDISWHDWVICREVENIHDHISWYDWMMCHEKAETYKQCCGSRFIESGSGFSIFSKLGSGYRSRVLITKNWKKYSWNFFLFFFWSKISIYLSLAFIKGHPSYRRSLQPSKENIQHSKRWHLFNCFLFFWAFLPSWIRIQIRIHTTALKIHFYISWNNVTDVSWVEIWSNHDHISWLNLFDVSWVERSNHEHWSQILS